MEGKNTMDKMLLSKLKHSLDWFKHVLPRLLFLVLVPRNDSRERKNRLATVGGYQQTLFVFEYVKMRVNLTS